MLGWSVNNNVLTVLVCLASLFAGMFVMRWVSKRDESKKKK